MKLAAALGALHLDGINAGFVPFVYYDDKDPSSYIVQFWQAGLGLPDRDYYLRTGQGSRDLLVKYEAHVARMFGLLGDDPQAAAKEQRFVRHEAGERRVVAPGHGVGEAQLLERPKLKVRQKSNGL